MKETIERENTKFTKLKYFSDTNFNGFIHEFSKISKKLEVSKFKSYFEHLSEEESENFKLFLKKKFNALYQDVFHSEVLQDQAFGNNSIFGNQENLNYSFEIHNNIQIDDNNNEFHIDKDSFDSMDSNRAFIDIDDKNNQGSIDEGDINDFL